MSHLTRATFVTAVTSVIFLGAIFGFFYAWVCSTMWGLDAADPVVAIDAMQHMNASVRNGVFFPAFFLTPVVCGAAAVLAMRDGRRVAGVCLGAAGVVYLVGGLALTAAINVPMNERLADVDVASLGSTAEAVWRDYSGPWQVWNTVRTVCSGTALALAAVGVFRLGQPVVSRAAADVPAAPQQHAQCETGVKCV